ncbi:MAG: NAD(P)-dependent oxidoreductase [Firmicutes bacterium]|jgi:predicted homoserine dehydrogenase-like protein|nr:NAD(P)-dependent oxidoreductase [Bacillota bacterium]MDH7495725.1 NAD(P)-dependent oxidoreductase [Bacillota bacterium]
MYAIDEKLEELHRAGTPIRVGLIGVGQMGKDILAQVRQMKGIEICVAVDLDSSTVLEGLKLAQDNREPTLVDSAYEAARMLGQSRVLVSTRYEMATRTPQVQVVIDATGSPEMGARIALDAINHKKHVVMMNLECDVTVGPILRQLADNAGVIYTLTAGDEPGSIMELYRFAKALGLKVVAAGKGKNNPLDPYATPDEWAERAKTRSMSPRMLVEFVDGSKTMVEMAAVANATGLVPDIRGMHGPKCVVKDLAKVFCRKHQGGILEREGVVDFAIGDVHPGVFLVVTTDQPRLIDSLIQRDMGNGPNYLLYRPYHLCGMETPLTAAQAVLYHEATMQPLKRPLTAECIAIAKRHLPAGTVLDGIGEYCYRGSIELGHIARNEKMLPLGLAKGARLVRDVRKDEIITYDSVELVDSTLLQLRRIQDGILN